MRSLGRCGRKRRKTKSKNERTATEKGEKSSSQSQNAFFELQRWMKRQVTETSDGNLYQKLQLYDFLDTGRGIRALGRFKRGDCIVSVPYKLLMTMDTVFDYIGQELMWHGTMFTPQQALTLLLSIETVKGSSSKWSPYVNTLPKEYNTPLYFSTDEMKMLHGKAKEWAERLRKRFRTACHEMMSFLRESFPSLRHLVTEEVLRWAWSTVDTRSVYLETKPHGCLQLNPEESNVALAPFLDMLNHSDTADIAARLNPACNCYEITTETEYNKYDQVFISYGPHDNTKLLINYGFTLPHNINNCYSFSTDDLAACFPKAGNWDRKLILLEDCDLHKSLVCTMDGLSWSLTTALKLGALSWDQLCLWKKLLQGISLGEENEATAIDMARTLVKEALWKAQRHQTFVRSRPPTVHQNLILQLATDDVEILEHSLKTITMER